MAFDRSFNPPRINAGGGSRSSIAMRCLLIVASILFTFSPARGAVSSPKATHQPQGSLRYAKFSRGDAPQSASSNSSAPRKKKTSKKKRTSARRRPSQMAPTPDRISDIQSALARGGYYKGEPSRKLDPSTIDALQRFQSANGLDANGKLDALTLQKLGLGSDIAGVSSPKGIVPHSCCAMSPSPSLAPQQGSASHSPANSSAMSADTKSSGSLSGSTPAGGLSDPATTASSH